MARSLTVLTFTPPVAVPSSFTRRLNDALGHLYVRYDNVEKVNEQALAGVLLVELAVACADLTLSAPVGQRYMWDTEYRRAGAGMKNLAVLSAAPGFTRATRAIVPDLIFHRPHLAAGAATAPASDGPDNLVMVEVKRTASPAGLLDDWAKLALMTDAVDTIILIGAALRRTEDADPHQVPDAVLERPRGTGLDRYELGLSVNLWRDHAEVDVFDVNATAEPAHDVFDPAKWWATTATPARKPVPATA